MIKRHITKPRYYQSNPGSPDTEPVYPYCGDSLMPAAQYSIKSITEQPQESAQSQGTRRRKQFYVSVMRVCDADDIATPTIKFRQTLSESATPISCSQYRVFQSHFYASLYRLQSFTNCNVSLRSNQ